MRKYNIWEAPKNAEKHWTERLYYTKDLTGNCRIWRFDPNKETKGWAAKGGWESVPCTAFDETVGPEMFVVPTELAWELGKYFNPLPEKNFTDIIIMLESEYSSWLRSDDEKPAFYAASEYDPDGSYHYFAYDAAGQYVITKIVMKPEDSELHDEWMRRKRAVPRFILKGSNMVQDDNFCEVFDLVDDFFREHLAGTLVTPIEADRARDFMSELEKA